MNPLEYILIGSILFILGAILGLWRMQGILDGYKISKRDCDTRMNHQTVINSEILERVTRVETKVDIGFKMIGEKIDNGRK